MATERQHEPLHTAHAAHGDGRRTTYAIICGFGLPGRAVADFLHARNIPFAVIETNEEVVARCTRNGITMIPGDCSDPAILQHAGIDRADLLAICVPVDDVVLRTIPVARQLNPNIRILARCAMTSNGMKARALGADEIIIAEQVVATEFTRVLSTPVSP